MRGKLKWLGSMYFLLVSEQVRAFALETTSPEDDSTNDNLIATNNVDHYYDHEDDYFPPELLQPSGQPNRLPTKKRPPSRRRWPHPIRDCSYRRVTLTIVWVHNVRRKGVTRLNRQMSPRALYPNPPPPIDVRATSITRATGCAAATSSSGGSNSGNAGSGSGSAGSNGFMRINNYKGGKGGPTQQGGDGSELDLDTFEWVPDSQFSLTSDPDFSPLTVLDNISLKTDFPPYMANGGEIDKPPDLDPPGGSGASTEPPNLFQFTASVPPVPDDFNSSVAAAAAAVSNVTDVFTQSLYDELVDINLNDFNLASVTTVPSSIAQSVLMDVKVLHTFF